MALERWLDLGGADLDERAGQVAAELGLAVDLDHPMTALSGGQAARAGMASLLLSRYDVYLLDEPTNDLDLDGLRRLEDFVAGLRAGTVLVSHDREFLTRTVTKVLELDLAQQQVNLYGGGYAAYLDERERARRHAREEYEEYAGKKDDLLERARTQRAWMEKGVRNARRKATDPDKHVKHFRGETSEKQAAKARQTEKLIERLEVVEEPRKEWELRMEIAAAPRAGAVVATMRDAVVRRGSFTLGPVTLQIDWADRVAITGANGSGKSTLLAAMLGRIAAGRGHVRARVRAWWSARWIRRAGCSTGAEPLIRAFGAAVPGFADAEIRTLLAKFGLRAAHVLRPAGTLSPGERTRAALALLQARGVNLLVLDEPTNHLDLPAIEQLESALAAYDGTLLLVTHDRRMLDAVHTDPAPRGGRRQGGEATPADGHLAAELALVAGAVQSGEAVGARLRCAVTFAPARPVATSVRSPAVDAVERPAHRLLRAELPVELDGRPAWRAPTSRGAEAGRPATAPSWAAAPAWRSAVCR